MMNEEGMRTALHRSVWFWLGCFVLVFLVWAWADSWRTRTEVSRTWILESSASGGFPVHGHYVDDAMLECGSIWIRWNRAKITEPTMKAVYLSRDFLREPADAEEEEWFAMPEVSREVEGDVPGVTVVIGRVNVPMWGVVLLYLMLWGGVMMWRRRRLRGGNIEHRTPNIE